MAEVKASLGFGVSSCLAFLPPAFEPAAAAARLLGGMVLAEGRDTHTVYLSDITTLRVGEQARACLDHRHCAAAHQDTLRINTRKRHLPSNNPTTTCALALVSAIHRYVRAVWVSFRARPPRFMTCMSQIFLSCQLTDGLGSSSSSSGVGVAGRRGRGRTGVSEMRGCHYSSSKGE